jgi:hypothetical protein
MSQRLHGRPETRQRDREIREELRNQGYEAVEIQFGQLSDRDAMAQHFFRIGRFLLGRDVAQRLRSDYSWFEAPEDVLSSPPRSKP